MKKHDILECLKTQTSFALLVLCIGMTLIPQVSAIQLAQNQYFEELVDGQLKPYKIKPQDLVIEEDTEEFPGEFVYKLLVSTEETKVLVLKNAESPDHTQVFDGDGVIFLNPEIGLLVGKTRNYAEQQKIESLEQFLHLIDQDGGILDRELKIPVYYHERWPAELMAETLINNKKVLEGISKKSYGDKEIDGYNGPIYSRMLQDISIPDSSIGGNYFRYANKKAMDIIKKNYDEIAAVRRLDLLNSLNGAKRMFYDEPEKLGGKLAPIVNEGLKKLGDNALQYIFINYIPKVLYPLFEEKGVLTFLRTFESNDVNLLLSSIIEPKTKTTPVNLGFGKNLKNLGLGTVILEDIKEKYREYARPLLQEGIAGNIDEGDLEDHEENQRKILNEMALTLNEKLVDHQCGFSESELEKIIEDIVQEIKPIEFLLNTMIEKIENSLILFIKNYMKYTVNSTLLRKLLLNLTVFKSIQDTDETTLSTFKISEMVNYYGRMVGANLKYDNFMAGATLFEDHIRLTI